LYILQLHNMHTQEDHMYLLKSSPALTGCRVIFIFLVVLNDITMDLEDQEHRMHRNLQ
jgi:hypothetical protein